MKKLVIIACTLATANLAISQTLPSYVPSSGIIAWWPFNGNSNDESGKGNNGTLYGATLTKDRSNQTDKAYNFSSDSIVISNTNNFKLPNFTVSGWIKTSSPTNADYHTLFSHLAGSSGSYSGYWLGVWSGRVNMFLGSGTFGIDITGPNLVNDGKWHLITGVYNGTAGSVYLDGVLASSSNFSLGFKSEQTMIGNDYVDEDFLGDLDDIGVWDRALTQQEITNLYKGSSTATNGNLPTNTISLYPNPTKDVISLDLGQIDNIIGYEVKLFNSVGQEVLKSGLENQITSLNIVRIPNGVYYVKIINNNNIVSIQKVVKQ